MADNHFVKIQEILYEDIKEYCSLNGMKITNFVNRCLREKLNIEKYGDIPFGTIKPNITIEDNGDVNLHTDHTGDQGEFVIPEREEEKVVENFISKITEGANEAEKVMGEIIENVGGPDEFSDLISECLTDTPKEEPKNDEPKSAITTEIKTTPKPRKRRL